MKGVLCDICYLVYSVPGGLGGRGVIAVCELAGSWCGICDRSGLWRRCEIHNCLYESLVKTTTWLLKGKVVFSVGSLTV